MDVTKYSGTWRKNTGCIGSLGRQHGYVCAVPKGEYIGFVMTSSNGNALLAICAGNSSVTGEFPSQKPVTRSVDVFFDLRLNKRLSKQW